MAIALGGKGPFATGGHKSCSATLNIVVESIIEIRASHCLLLISNSLDLMIFLPLDQATATPPTMPRVFIFLKKDTFSIKLHLTSTMNKPICAGSTSTPLRCNKEGHGKHGCASVVTLMRTIDARVPRMMASHISDTAMPVKNMK